MKRWLLVCAALLAATPAFAANSCYTKAEVDAEQLLRLHSELMVITVTCRYGSQGQNLVPAYTDFTKKNITELHDAEQTMLAYYQKHGGGGTDALDKLRTRLGNEFGQRIADVSAPEYCKANRDRVLLISTYKPEYVANEVEIIKASTKTYVPECKEEIKIAKKK